MSQLLKINFFCSCVLKQALLKMDTMDLTPDKITKILTRFTERYMHFYGHKNPKTINLGECFVWAWSVYSFMQRQGLYCELVTCRSHGGHAWVIVNGLAYDSERLEGCDSDDSALDFINEDEEQTYPLILKGIF